VYALTIVAEDGQFSSLLKNNRPNQTPQKFRIVIKDKNDNPPYFPQQVRIRLFSFPDPGSELSPSRIRIKELKYFNPKKGFLSSRKYDPGFSSRIRMLTFYPSRIQGSKRHRISDPDPQHCCLLIYTFNSVRQKSNKFSNFLILQIIFHKFLQNISYCLLIYTFRLSSSEIL
jgi:hypothetical protein